MVKTLVLYDLIDLLFILTVASRAVLPYWSTHTSNRVQKQKHGQPYKHKKLITITLKLIILSVEIKVLNREYKGIIIAINWNIFHDLSSTML